MQKSSLSFLVTFSVGILCASLGMSGYSQVNREPENAKLLTFDVVSIRPSGGARPAGGLNILPDGYEAIAMPLETTLIFAYTPAPFFKHLDEVKGIPSWASGEKYDFQAKLAATDVAQWRNLHQNIMQTPSMLQEMLRQVLAERCKLRIHSTEIKTDGFALRIRAKSPALMEDSTLPTGDHVMELTDGAKAVFSVENGERTYTFYNTTMSVLATFISIPSLHPVEDRTGLKGRYRFVLRRLPPPPSDQDTAPQIDLPVPWDLGALGMKVDSEKVNSKLWIVDGMERPSSN